MDRRRDRRSNGKIYGELAQTAKADGSLTRQLSRRVYEDVDPKGKGRL